MMNETICPTCLICDRYGMVDSSRAGGCVGNYPHCETYQAVVPLYAELEQAKAECEGYKAYCRDVNSFINEKYRRFTNPPAGCYYEQNYGKKFVAEMGSEFRAILHVINSGDFAHKAFREWLAMEAVVDIANRVVNIDDDVSRALDALDAVRAGEGKQMAKYKDGHFFDLIWEWGPEEFYVKGHIDPQSALEILQRELPGMKFTTPVPAYGRFSMDARSECDSILVIYTERGRGRFPLMVARPDGYEEVATHDANNS